LNDWVDRDGRRWQGGQYGQENGSGAACFFHEVQKMRGEQRKSDSGAGASGKGQGR
jgi:hypothetical protein